MTILSIQPNTLPVPFAQTPTRGKERSCFISTSRHANVDTIKEILKKNNLQPILGTALWSEPLSEIIAKADLVIAVLDAHQSNDNVFYEVGLANAHNKRILIVVPPALKTLPTDLSEMFTIRADADNYEAIRFALGQALAIGQPIKRRQNDFPASTSRPLGSPAQELKATLLAQGETLSKQFLIQVVTEAFEKSGVSAIVPALQPAHGADLVIWEDSLSSWGGNPLLIEIMPELKAEAQVEAVIKQMTHYMEKGNAPLALVLYWNETGENLPLSAIYTPPILFLSILELMERLEDHTFGEIVWELRNHQARQG